MRHVLAFLALALAIIAGPAMATMTSQALGEASFGAPAQDEGDCDCCLDTDSCSMCCVAIAGLSGSIEAAPALVGSLQPPVMTRWIGLTIRPAIPPPRAA